MNDAIPVSLLNGYLKKIIDAEQLLNNVRVYGEVCDFSTSKNIAYFSLKDENALISCVCFNSAFFPLLKNGMQVVLTGKPNFWVKGGRLSFSVSKAEEFGQGAAYLKFLQLKEKLEKLGLFDSARKKAIPKFSKNIGVVSSRTGAVIRDIYNVSMRRNPFVNIVLYPSQVQGEGASKTIIEGVKFLDGFGVDLIIIARGGGSSEDLSAFNDEELAYAVANAKTPIISAVGHETDFSICDFVADLRAPTPSAAAELATIDVKAFFEFLTKNLSKISNNLTSKLDANLLKLNLYKTRLKSRLESDYSSKVSCLKTGIASFKSLGGKCFDKSKNQVDILSSKFEKLNPLEILQRGFAKISKNGQVASFASINSGDEIDIDLTEGTVSAVVKDKKEKK